MPRAPAPHSPKDAFPARYDWLAKAAQLSGKALHLSIALSWLSATYGKSAIPLTRRSLAHWNISRDACYDNLRSLEQAGLVRVWRLPGRAPVVVLTEPGTDKALAIRSPFRA
jgi:hypothetical protein